VKRRYALGGGLVGPLLLLAACGGGASGSTEPAAPDLAAMSAEELEAAALDEGEVSWFTTMYPTETTALVAESFMKKYPGITVEYERGSTNETWEKFSTGMQAGVSPADVYTTTQLDLYEDAAEAGFVDCYLPPGAEDLRPEYLSPEGCWFSSRVSTVAVVYNTDKVGAADVPKSYQDLLAPRWQGKIGLFDASTHATGYSGYYALSQMLGDGDWQGSRDFWTQLGENEPALFPQAGPLVNAMVAGEVDIALTFAYRGHELKAQGAPVDVVYPEEGVASNADFTALVAGSDQPHAAALFMEYLASDEAMDLGAKNAFYFPVRESVQAYPEGRPALDELTLLPPDWEGQLTDHDAWIAMWNEVVAP
jgi:iron(III) transport system substrate-binding protein